MVKRYVSNSNWRKVWDRLPPKSYDYTNKNVLSKTNLKISTSRIQILPRALKRYFK